MIRICVVRCQTGWVGKQKRFLWCDISEFLGCGSAGRLGGVQDLWCGVSDVTSLMSERDKDILMPQKYQRVMGRRRQDRA